MYSDALQENLVDELTRLVGRPTPVVREGLARLLSVMVDELEPAEMQDLALFPLTAWQSLASQHRGVLSLWSAVLSAGLTLEEVFTTLAVVDDHARRRFGNDAWVAVREWGPALARQYQFEISRRSPSTPRRGEVVSGVSASA